MTVTYHRLGLVWVTADRRRFTMRPVKVGLLRDGYYQILEGLRSGELVATEGALFLRQRVRDRAALRRERAPILKRVSMKLIRHSLATRSWWWCRRPYSWIGGATAAGRPRTRTNRISPKFERMTIT
jgi:hypothetical protein